VLLKILPQANSYNNRFFYGDVEWKVLGMNNPHFASLNQELANPDPEMFQTEHCHCQAVWKIQKNFPLVKSTIPTFSFIIIMPFPPNFSFLIYYADVLCVIYAFVLTNPAFSMS
jgi:hypothetical protein